ncbi:MAG: maleylpyruvate isomerase family mycothiol-dependent enzyme [Acidimicrobiia bacterium]|nr:maleylpyruvate isomerase family mycothiol-dependent enzyme [Acidimicrobiia bacterium]
MRAAARLLDLESRALPPILDALDPAQFQLPTVCDLWSVRDVIAHCAAAMTRLAAGTTSGYTAADNQVDVDTRREWPIERVIAELRDAYPAAVDAVELANGSADGVGLGEWVHGGDLRDALGVDGAYASVGVDLAVGLLSERSRRLGVPGVHATVDGIDIPFGEGPPSGWLRTDTSTFVRLCAGRKPDPNAYTLSGVEPGALVLFS